MCGSRQSTAKMSDSISDLKSEVKSMKESQETNMSTINNNVTDVKAQIIEMNTSITNLSKEQNQLKSSLLKLEKRVDIGEKKLEILENDISKLSVSSIPSTSHTGSQPLVNEELLMEFQERIRRQRNLILVGVAEQKCKNAEERHTRDDFDVMKILKAFQDIPTPIKIHRIGKYKLSDPTGCAQIHYDTSKCNTRINSSCMNDLTRSFAKASRMSCDDVDTMHFMLDKIEQKYKNPVDFEEGDFLSVLGDIFVENLKDIRIINAYECKKTNVDRDIVWLEELRYVYDKLYIKQGI
ncbi:unnamed protein product [Leptidea sinapis]|uniref:Uncharacterized protein n=1 Tax=Leptidea sinapis TaxID=189913 RepID=A0A5E4QVR1_9NEOP|nr:unnamed protein product [Leptidea sinapis]